MERYLLETCYLLTRDLYQIFITFFAMSFMLKPRYHRAICVSASVLYSFASEQLLLDGPPLLHGVGIALSFFLPALFLYKDKLMYRLFAAGFLAAGSIIMDVCVSGFVMLIDVNLLVSLKTFHTWDTIIMIIAMNFFFTGGFLLIMSVWNHFFRKSHVKSLGLFVMFPVFLLLRVRLPDLDGRTPRPYKKSVHHNCGCAVDSRGYPDVPRPHAEHQNTGADPEAQRHAA